MKDPRHDEKGFEARLRAELREIAEAPEFPRERIRARIRHTLTSRATPARSPRRPVPVLAGLAASVLLFVAGAAYGRWSASPAPAASGRTAALPAATELPASIQAEGTRYVAALTRLTESADSLTPEQREQARQVALAVLYGAALELMRYAPEDPVAADVYRSVVPQRRRGYDAGETSF